MKTSHVVFCVVILAVSAAIAACSAFDLGDMVQTKTPPAVQQQTGLPPKLTLNEAEGEYRAYFDSTQRNLSQWKGNIEQANEFRGILSQLTLHALDEVGPIVAGGPVLGPALPALTGLVGLFLGTSKLRKEKEASYNAGIEKGTEVQARAP